MTTKECPDHLKLNTGLQRIIAESVAETLSETDRDIGQAWRDALRRRKKQAVSIADTGAQRPRRGGPKG